MPRLLDLFAGRLGWSKAFLERGWDVIAIDLTLPAMDIPERCIFIKADVLQIRSSPYGLFSIREFDDRGPFLWEEKFDFVCASPPCEQFSVHGMKHFHPNPPNPDMGIKLFDHTRSICENSGLPYIMENVRPAQQFVGPASHHCGPFYLWGNAVPPLMPGGRITKNFGNMSIAHYHANLDTISSHIRAKTTATIPSEISACVANYAERLLEVTR